MFGGGRMVWAVCRLTGAGHLSLIAAFPLSLNFSAVPGLNCAHQNLPYIQVLTVQREWEKLGLN